MTADVAMAGVSKAFGEVQAVDNVSFEVEPESFFSLLGPSGCGKTTILRIIAGFETPDRGDVYIRGEQVNRRPPYRRNTAMVFQNYALFPHMTVYDNVAFGLRYRKVDQTVRGPKVGAALEQVGLTGLERRYPSQLSGGQQQRVALARAIVTQPALLLLDEPLSNLDLRLRQRMRSELRGIQREVRITTIYVTHDQAEAFSMSSRIAVMDKGQILQIGTPDDIYLRPANEFVLNFIGETNSYSVSVISRSTDEVTVKADDDIIFRLQVPPEEAGGVAVGDDRQLFFREEQARLTRSPGSGNVFPCVVEAIQNLGSMRTLTVRVGTRSRIRATVPTTNENRLAVGDAAFVEVDPVDCVLIGGL
jgi:ABC-type Fe3+/spermidine/putrescine transport system ATPase subunit